MKIRIVAFFVCMQSTVAWGLGVSFDNALKWAEWRDRYGRLVLGEDICFLKIENKQTLDCYGYAPEHEAYYRVIKNRGKQSLATHDNQPMLKFRYDEYKMNFERYAKKKQ